MLPALRASEMTGRVRTSPMAGSAAPAAGRAVSTHVKARTDHLSDFMAWLLAWPFRATDGYCSPRATAPRFSVEQAPSPGIGLTPPPACPTCAAVPGRGLGAAHSGSRSHPADCRPAPWRPALQFGYEPAADHSDAAARAARPAAGRAAPVARGPRAAAATRQA